MINNPNPITTEPVPSKVFDKLHPYYLSVTQNIDGTGTIAIELIPCNENGEVAPVSEKIICPLTTDSLQAVPELQSAYNAVIAAIPATKAWLNSQNNI